MFHLAAELVNQSGRNIFLTGKAGTGKTTFLKYIRENCVKQISIVAPTGVAAINAGGVTIHSFFQLPFTPFIPEAQIHPGELFRQPSAQNDEVTNRSSLISRLRITNEKKKVIQQLELLVIDEISMVRCDVLDAIDTVLRHIRHRPYERFGGVQVLLIGDMFQLPPVVKEDEWRLLADYYNSPYFFDSKVMQEDPPLYIEFNKIYRQSEEQFIDLLNQVRNNELNEEGMKLLDSRIQPGFRRSKHDGYIILTTHNYKADTINNREMEQLEGRLYSFTADIENDFSEKSYPADDILQLKIGTQVMFIKNDTDRTKRYFNGKIGEVSRIEGDKIFVRCKDDDLEIEVKKERWENIRYTMNKTTRQIDEELLGSFTQYPLRLAWAITIHKSQGLTFEKAIIDAGESFAHGQVYVALSRCTNLDGMILQSRVSRSGLHTDNRIIEFSQSRISAGKLQSEINGARREYQLKLLFATFDFTTPIAACKEIIDYVNQHKTSFNNDPLSHLLQLQQQLIALQETAMKFQQWLAVQFNEATLPEENTVLLDRLKSGSAHFITQLDKIIIVLKGSAAVTDSKLHAKEYNDSLKEIYSQLTLSRYIVAGYDGKIDTAIYHQRKKSFLVPSFTINAYAGASKQVTESPHPVLHQQLRKLRESICIKNDLPVYLVAGTKTLDEMATYLPQTPEELRKISGFGDAKVKNYGEQFLSVINQYCEEQGLSSLINTKTPKKERKEKAATRTNTKLETFTKYKEGLTVAEIARDRNLTIQTIEGHLAFYIQKGEIDIDQLVDPAKKAIILSAIEGFNGGSVTPIKEKLGNTVSYGEIRLVLAYMNR